MLGDIMRLKAKLTIFLSAMLLFKNGDNRIKLPSIADVVLH